MPKIYGQAWHTRFGLSAPMAVPAIAQPWKTYKHDKSRRRAVSQKQRAKTDGWAICQRRASIADKARRAGVEVMVVDPRPARGTCPASGYTGPAGVNAARTMRVWAAIKRPTVSESPQTIVVESRDKPRPSGLGSDQDVTTRPIHGGEGERAPKHPQF